MRLAFFAKHHRHVRCQVTVACIARRLHDEARFVEAGRQPSGCGDRVDMAADTLVKRGENVHDPRR